MPANAITAASIANRTRFIFLAGTSFQGRGANVERANFFASQTGESATTWRLPDAGNAALSTQFIVPADFVAGPPPTVTVLWATDDPNAPSTTINVHFSRATDMTANNSAVTFRGVISGTAAQSAIVTGSLSSFANSPANWNPGDVILFNVSRATDANPSNVYIYGVRLDYNADQ